MESHPWLSLWVVTSVCPRAQLVPVLFNISVICVWIWGFLNQFVDGTKLGGRKRMAPKVVQDLEHNGNS